MCKLQGAKGKIKAPQHLSALSQASPRLPAIRRLLFTDLEAAYAGDLFD